MLAIILTPPLCASLFLFHLLHIAVMTAVPYGTNFFQFAFQDNPGPSSKLYFLTVENSTKVMAKVCCSSTELHKR